MNTFRDFSALLLLLFGIGLLIKNPTEWPQIDLLGGDVVSALDFCNTFRPFPSVLCFLFVAMLVMTRKKF